MNAAPFESNRGCWQQRAVPLHAYALRARLAQCPDRAV